MKSFVSPQELIEAGLRLSCKNKRLEDLNHEDHLNLMVFFCINIPAALAPSAMELMSTMYDLPVSLEEIKRICILRPILLLDTPAIRKRENASRPAGGN